MSHFHKRKCHYIISHSVYGNHYLSNKMDIKIEYGRRMMRKLGCINGRWYGTGDG